MIGQGPANISAPANRHGSLFLIFRHRLTSTPGSKDNTTLLRCKNIRDQPGRRHPKLTRELATTGEISVLCSLLRHPIPKTWEFWLGSVAGASISGYVGRGEIFTGREKGKQLLSSAPHKKRTTGI